MKIDDIQRINSINPYRKNAQQQQQVETQKKSGRKDEVQFSMEARALLGSDRQQEALAQKQSDKVAELKKAVTTGTYHVEAGKVAEKLLPFFKE